MARAHEASAEHAPSSAQHGTDLALARTYLAAERTLMGWIRTALSMITFGFTIGKLAQMLDTVEVKGVLRVRTVSVKQLALFLVIFGTTALVAASVQHRLRVHQLYAMGLERHVSVAFIVAIVLSVVGAFSMTALVLSA